MSATASLFALLLLAAGVLAWQLLRGMHESALAVAQRSCREAGLQLLDASVALLQLRWAREDGAWGWRLDYGFDVSSDGSRRGHGRIRFHRGALRWIRMPGETDGRDLWVVPHE
ncbi:MAG: DUF3301 domain-containing protein [Xanthomonadales bacterium]|nr:hypothetical protein [Xanthomonadales bacterium]MCC6593857.1 DUF3301 domain-containing protein [Xanthomonadales bacterium]